MPATESVKLRDLLPAALPAMQQTVADALQRDPHSKGASLAWRFIGEEAGEAIRGALDGDLFETLAEAWSKVRVLRQYTTTPADETAVVHLSEHKFPATVPIELSVMIGPLPGPTLHFALELVAHFRSAAVSIRGGRIVALDSGDCSVSAQLKYGDKELHDAIHSHKVAIPGRIKFPEPGLAIG